LKHAYWSMKALIIKKGKNKSKVIFFRPEQAKEIVFKDGRVILVLSLENTTGTLSFIPPDNVDKFIEDMAGFICYPDFVAPQPTIMKINVDEEGKVQSYLPMVQGGIPGIGR